MAASAPRLAPPPHVRCSHPLPRRRRSTLIEIKEEEELKEEVSSSSDEEDKTSKHETRRETQLTEAWRLLVRRRDGLHTLLSREEIYHLQDNYNGDAVDEQRTSLRAVFPTIRSIDSSPDLSSRSK